MTLGLIPPGEDVAAGQLALAAHATATHEELCERWLAEDARALLEEWEAGGFDRAFISARIGTFYGKLDLRGVPLADKDLSGGDLSNCEFFAAQLARSRMVGCRLDGSHFSEADLRGADLSWSSAREALFDNVKFDHSTKLLGIPLHSVNFNLAYLLYDQAKTEQRIAHLKRRSPALAVFLEYSCDYGRSVGRWMLWVVTVNAVFSFVFFALRAQFQGINSPGDAAYFSAITFTTLGYGDILPITAQARLLAVGDVVTGYVMGGLLISIFARRVIGD